MNFTEVFKQSFKNKLRCLLLLKCTHFIYLKNNHSINEFYYDFLKIHGNTCGLNV